VTRPAASIGAGLEPARDPAPLTRGSRIHVVGAGGAGASGAALLARAGGAIVDGCDAGPAATPYEVALAAAGIAVARGHDPTHVTTPPHPDRLAVTKALTAIDPDHPELAAARGLGIPVEAWQQVVADAAFGRTLVAIAGTHGKSTTAGWLVHLLSAAGADPSAFVGALLPSELVGGPPATARWGRGSAFVVEADEYAGNFDAYRPATAVLTNAEWDHPDVFADRAAVVAAFVGWIEAATAFRERTGEPPPVLVANVGDAGVADVVAALGPWPGTVVATALVDGAAPRSGLARGIAEQFATAGGLAQPVVGRLVAADRDGTVLEIGGLDALAGAVPVHLSLAGRHNASNALGVVGAALALGVDPVAIRDGLAGFSGVGRRLERKGEAHGVVVYDDYGHHPTAIVQTIGAVRQLEPDRRVWAVYEPLTYHRTAALLDGFATALATADAVAVADIWAGRDVDLSIASAEGLAEAVARARPGIEVAAPGSVEQTADWLAGRVRAGDVVLVMGGGRSYRIGELLLEHLG